MADDFTINSIDAIEQQTIKTGFLPFFSCAVPGISIEEHTPDELWFSDEVEGPWEWKGPVIERLTCAYGKLFDSKAGYVSLPWYAHLANYRRNAFKMTKDEKAVLEAIVENDSMLVGEIKRACGYVKPRATRRTLLERTAEKAAGVSSAKIDTLKRSVKKRESIDRVLTRLQMSCRVVIGDFEYKYTADGRRYTWGWARYTTPEALYGPDWMMPAKGFTPKQSLKLIEDHLHSIYANATVEQLKKLIY